MDTIITMQVITVIVVGVIGYFLKRYISLNDKFQEQTGVELKQIKDFTTVEIDEIKKNYLSRFDDVKDRIVLTERNIINKIMELMK